MLINVVTKRWRFKGCPKCGGDLFPEYDIETGDTDMSCLQCGHKEYLRKESRRCQIKTAKDRAAVLRDRETAGVPVKVVGEVGG